MQTGNTPDKLHSSRLPRWLLGLVMRPRLLASVTVGILTYLMLPHAWASHEVTRAIVAWNAGAILYLVLALRMMFGSSHDRMKTRALQHDNGRVLVLALAVMAALVCLVGVVAQLSVAKDLHGLLKAEHVGLAAFTVLSAWSFTQLAFALHYAHEYYVAQSRGHDGGLAFPGGHAPDYGDFLYFACVIGTSGQTADVSFTTRNLRRVGLIHCVFSFVFNTTLVALTINMASGLI